MITIFGSSDDLIEVDGDIREEFCNNEPEDRINCMAFSDGTLLSINYSKDGIWRIHPVRYGKSKYEKTEATGADRDYSDKITLSGEKIEWCVLGEAALAKRE